MKTKYWICLLFALAVLSGMAGFFLLRPNTQAELAQVKSNGVLIQTVDLRLDQEFTVTTESGYNVLTVRDGKIAVTDASCPDHYCMDRGYCAGGAQIVCLPNRLVIQFLAESEIDGAVG